MSFPAYPKYKNSGVDWLGDVPLHWERRTLKQIVSTPITDGPHETPNFPDQGIPFVSAEAIASGNVDFSKIRGFISREDHARYSEKYVPKRGDIYMVKSGATTGVTAIVETDIEFNIWSPLAAIRCASTALPRFVLNYLRSRNFLEGVALNWSFGTQQNIGMRVIENLSIALPPLSEQITIAAFLDDETTKIDTLVAEQRRLIELLKEKRQAVITHAVTKGLDPNASMKPSGIYWIGNIPDHWALPPVYLRYEAVLGKMVDAKRATGKYPIPYLRNADVYWDQINVDDLPLIDLEPDEIERFTVRSGDILICEGGAGIGQTAIWENQIERCAFQKALHRLRPRTSTETVRYFYYCMRFAVETGVFLVDGGSTIPHLTGEKLRALRLPCPPASEQREIAAFLDTGMASFDALTAEAQRAINILEERRTALISAAVTGKIDVRGLAKGEAG
jgi:type I restriction enzyme S subunit